MLAASQTFHSKFQLTILVSLLSLLLGCSRDNPLNTPDTFIEPETPFCTDDSPFSFGLLTEDSPFRYGLLEDVSFTNISNVVVTPDPDKLSEDSANNRITKIAVSAPFLSNTTTITPNELTNYKRDERGQLVLNDDNEPIIILVNKAFTPDMLEHLNEEALEELDESVPEIISISYSIKYLSDGVLTTESFDEDITSLEANLQEGENSFTLSVKASVIVPKTGLECSDENADSRTRLVNLNYETEFTISRSSLDDFSEADLNTNGFVFNENDHLGRIIAVDDQFLFLGVPNESSNFSGVVPVAELIQNNSSAQSGAVFVFKKDENDTWSPHSVIKSSNNEAGDRFGTDVSLAGNYLVISAPDEDSNGSGIHSSSSANTSSIKVNNSALNSGAVYLFKYDTGTDSWLETHYIKPAENVISDGDYDKGFGKNIELTDDLLLISAPNENSEKGDPANSSLPNSGAVYVYNFSSDSENLSFFTTLKALNPGSNDLFGSSLSISDSHIAIGAPFEDNSKRSIFNLLQSNIKLEEIDNDLRKDSGSVYIYTRSTNSSLIEMTAYLKSTNSDEHDFFGTSLKLHQSTLFVSSIGEDSSGNGLNRDMLDNASTDSGAVYIFNLNQNTNNWAETAYIKADDNQSGSNFGQYLDYDKHNLVISAPRFNDIGKPDTGKIYLYEYKAGNLVQNLDYSPVGASENMQLGSSLSIKNKHLILGASEFIDDTSGTPKSSVGKVIYYQ